MTRSMPFESLSARSPLNREATALRVTTILIRGQSASKTHRDEA